MITPADVRLLQSTSLASQRYLGGTKGNNKTLTHNLSNNPSARIPNQTVTSGFDPQNLTSSVFHHSINVSKSGDYKSARPSKTQLTSQNATPSKSRKPAGQQHIVKLAKKKGKSYNNSVLGTTRLDNEFTTLIPNTQNIFGSTPNAGKQIAIPNIAGKPINAGQSIGANGTGTIASMVQNVLTANIRRNNSTQGGLRTNSQKAKKVNNSAQIQQFVG